MDLQKQPGQSRALTGLVSGAAVEMLLHPIPLQRFCLIYSVVVMDPFQTKHFIIQKKNINSVLQPLELSVKSYRVFREFLPNPS